MLRPSKEEAVLDRTAEVASAVAEQYLQAGGESVLIVFLTSDEASFVTSDTSRWTVASKGQPPS
jgi:hypothetical protein